MTMTKLTQMSTYKLEQTKKNSKIPLSKRFLIFQFTVEPAKTKFRKIKKTFEGQRFGFFFDYSDS